MSALFDHLWQSTLFAGVLGLLTLAFRRNGAAVRYGLWFAASVKFLLPFSALIALGGYLFRPLAPAYTAPPVFYRMAGVAQPFSDAHSVIVAPVTTGLPVMAILFGVWFCGFAALTGVWLVRWARLNAVVRAARDIPIASPLPAKASPALLEPGLVGIWRPVLLLPEGILQRLSPPEMLAIEAHERCHFHRGDNLTAAIHMLIANIFWFHPLLWWLGARLVEERERACDESVLGAGNDPKTYADSILKVCRFYVHSPLACAAGVSGANLKQRLEMIMENRATLRLNAIKKGLLATVAATAIAVPVFVGLASSGAAQDNGSVTQERLAEQRQPRKEVAIDAAQFDKLAGYYRISPTDLYVVSRKGHHYFAGVIGQGATEMYPESASKFFLKGLSMPAQFSFTTDASGHGTEMVLHQNGEEQRMPRISDADGRVAEAALAQRIAANTQSPGTEDALRHQIDGLASGNPDYGKMMPSLAAGTRQMLGDLHAKVDSWGPVTAVKFVGVGKNGMDVYEVTCRNKRSKWEVAPLTPDGRISSIFFEEI
ncbi:MAG TPA: M56 family metallopeptidase [Rhizomicrobium sp.]|jgi:beta-lactamase regulating signal transducer with metallopeptidase domain